MKKIIIPIALLFLLLGGCEKNDTATTLESTVPLKVAATCAYRVTKAATTSPLTSGVNAGIYVAEQGTAIGASYFANQAYTSDASGVLSTATDNVSLTVGRNYDIYAYAPFQSGLTNATAVPFAHGTDVLCATKSIITNVSTNNHTVIIPFQHSAAQVTFNVVFASDFTAGSPVFTSSSSIKVTGFYPQSTLDVSTGILTPVGTATTSMSAMATGSTGSLTLGLPATCFVPATSGTMSFAVQVTHAGVTYNGTITDSFVAGSAYNYTIMIKGYSPVLGITGMLTDWTIVSQTININNSH